MAVENLLIFYLGGAVLMDVLHFRIANGYLAAGLIIFPALRILEEGLSPVLALNMLTGVVVPFLLCFFLFALSMMGAGDIKLLMVAGGALGGDVIMGIMFSALLISGAEAVFRLFFFGMWSSRAARLGSYMRRQGYLSLKYVGIKGNEPYIVSADIRGRRPWLMHLSLPILLAVLLHRLL